MALLCCCWSWSTLEGSCTVGVYHTYVVHRCVHRWSHVGRRYIGILVTVETIHRPSLILIQRDNTTWLASMRLTKKYGTSIGVRLLSTPHRGVCFRPQTTWHPTSIALTTCVIDYQWAEECWWVLDAAWLGQAVAIRHPIGRSSNSSNILLCSLLLRKYWTRVDSVHNRAIKRNVPIDRLHSSNCQEFIPWNKRFPHRALSRLAEASLSRSPIWFHRCILLQQERSRFQSISDPSDKRPEIYTRATHVTLESDATVGLRCYGLITPQVVGSF